MHGLGVLVLVLSSCLFTATNNNISMRNRHGEPSKVVVCFFAIVSLIMSVWAMLSINKTLAENESCWVALDWFACMLWVLGRAMERRR